MYGVWRKSRNGLLDTMITVKLNIKQVGEQVKQQIQKAVDPEYLLRPVSLEQIRLMHTRIHEDGIGSNGGQIGTYNKDYLKLRQEKFNRTSDPKTIVSLTRQLENDYSIVRTPLGYGVGFNNSFNFQKAKWVEQIKKTKIFDPTESELNAAIEFINELTDRALNS